MGHAYKKLGLFYLGRRYDLASRTRSSDLVLYDSKDLTTHAVCVGMTGSGKTGLAVGLIEECAMDGLPVLAIDPKGDLANLLLTFPSLAPSDFAPWVNLQVAAGKGLSVQAYAEQQATQWKSGLADWDQDGSRIAALKSAVEFAVYTPGSRAGTPLALLKSLAPADGADPESLGEHAAGIAASLLALAGVEASPQDREHALLANILATAWARDEHPDLPWLVRQIQKPAFEHIGVLDLETFYPARDRQTLALRFNAILASPTFDVWLSGEPMDIGSLLYTKQGRPRVAVVSIAHLDDAARMMVVSLLLTAVLEWTRRQTGTPALRAVVYMDEVAGYLPPVANPPSKAPLLTLLKQARAFGVGIMLSTQNPVDLDYKGLSNAGTWFLGKLQTERDKARVLDGLEGSAGGIDRPALDAMLSALPGRVFLMHNVHEQAPVTFETRWTMSYLRGPMGREELKRLSLPTPRTAAPDASQAMVRPSPAASTRASAGGAGTKPVLPAGIKEFYCPTNDSGDLAYEPRLYGAARVQYTDARRGIDVTVDTHLLTAFGSGALGVDWDTAEASDVSPKDLLDTAPAPGTYVAPPGEALKVSSYTKWTTDFERSLTRTAPLALLTAPALTLSSTHGESERDFRLRVQQAARERRDEAVEALRAKYAPIARAQGQVKRAEDAAARESQQAAQQKLQAAVSLGATVFGALLGRRSLSVSTLGRATTAVRGMGRIAKETDDVARAGTRVTDATQGVEEILADLEQEIDALSAELDPASVTIETTEIKPKRGGIDVLLVTLVWRGVPPK